jgi:hypothetical protein
LFLVVGEIEIHFPSLLFELIGSVCFIGDRRPRLERNRGRRTRFSETSCVKAKHLERM